MKSCILSLFFLSSSLTAQVAAQPAETLAPDSVLAIVDGSKVTFGELDGYLNGLGPQQKQAALANRPELLKQYALFKRLLDLANKEKLEEQSPYKEALATSRLQILANAAMNYKYLNIPVSADEQKKFYDANPDRYTQVKLQVIYIGFVADPKASADPSGKKYRTEEQAKAKMEELRKQIHTREDFIRMVQEYSEDQASKSKDGDFGTIKKSDNLPAEIKQVVFSLKQGEVSGIIPQRNGFYLFRADNVGLRPYDEVKDEIYNELKDQRVKQWLDTERNLPIKIENQAFFAVPMAPQAPAK